MNTSEPEGYTTTSKYFKIRDDESSDSDSETDSESDSESSSSSGTVPINIGMLKGYLNPKYYKEILVEEDLLPD
jgi:hypothetical protein